MNTIVERVAIQAQNNPGRPAVVFEQEEITYGELWDKTLKFANFLKAIGVCQNDKVVVQAKYSKWYIIACYASHLIHAVFVPVEKNATKIAIETISSRVKAAMIISDYLFDEINCVSFECIEDAITDAEEIADYVFPSLDEEADIMFTTGTTGVPKGVVLTHRNISCTAVTRINELSIKKDNVCITLVPLNHVAPMRELYLNSYNGSTVIFIDGTMKVKIMFDFMNRYNVSSIYVPPAGISVVKQFSKEKLKEFAASIDYVYTASSAMQEEQRLFMKKMLPKSRLYFSYGSSENGSVSLHRYHKDDKEITCVGIPCENVEVKIVDDTFKELPLGQMGTVSIKSDMNMKEYWEMPELTQQVFHEGYFISNDIGYMDEEGYLFITGRKDDVINIGGLKVFPSEIENAALKIIGVKDAVCFGVSDLITGQTPKLLIIVDESFDKNLKEVSNELSHFLDSYKVPKRIEFVDEIARTSNGKVDRKYYQNKIKE